MSIDEIKKELYNNVLSGDFELTKELAEKAISEGIDPLEAINSYLIPAIELVGEKFGKREYFLPDLMRSANAMKSALNIFENEIHKSGVERKSLGKIVIGTVKGDIHEIGKSIVAALLSAKGFDVTDLGIDVDSDAFINNIIEKNANILAMSALLPITMPYQGVVIEELKKRGLREKVRVMVGGAPVTQEHADKIGADGYADNAVDAVKLAEKLMAK
ncbi:MAG: corrinoid protein [Actinobacteria bacterium]|nr:corrinoid protein [Cyanobacteriota bacterium]MCL5771497.1 corrinoid protein [Actinomycetota bacterium]